MKNSITIAALACIASFACGEPRQATPLVAAPDTTAQVSEHVDSILETDEAIRRFSESLPPESPASELSGGAASRETLVLRFIRAVESNDTMALRAMVMNAREFIDLYYPSSQYTRPPYQLAPDVVWMMLKENGDKGYRRLIQRVAGKPLGYAGYTCSPDFLIEGQNRIVDGCTVEVSAGAASQVRLFSAIIERDGRFKFISYANDM